jgi:hypothetical protein
MNGTPARAGFLKYAKSQRNDPTGMLLQRQAHQTAVLQPEEAGNYIRATST